MDELRVS